MLSAIFAILHLPSKFMEVKLIGSDAKSVQFKNSAVKKETKIKINEVNKIKCARRKYY